MKLNFYRFIETEPLVLPFDVDDSGLKSKSPGVKKELTEMTETMETTSKAAVKLSETPLWSGKALTGARDAIRNYKKQFKEMQELAESPFATAKFKLEAQSTFNKDRISGFSGLKLKEAANVPQPTLNKLISGGTSIGKKNITETGRQQKELAKAELELAASIKEVNAPLSTQSVEFKKQETVITKFQTAMNGATTATDKLSAAFKNKISQLRHAAVSWRILYGAFSSIWNALSATVEKAAAYQEALNLYTVAMGDYAEEGRKWAEKISTALFLDPKQIMQYTGAFYNLVQGLGVGSQAAYKMSTNLTQLSYDMSSYLNIDVESAHDKLQSAITGQSRAVASAGIAMQQASLQELAYSLGIKKSVSEMTQAEKTYLRYIQILRSTANMQGDLARTIVTPENAIRVIKQQFELLGRAIGNVFIPIVINAIPYVMALTRALTALANKLATMFGFKIASIDYSSLKTADTAVEDTFNNISNSAGTGAKSVGDSINRTLAAFDELNVVESESKGSGGGGIGGIGADPDTLSALEEYIDGYDMLAGLNDELSKKTEVAYENLKKLADVAKILGIAFVTWKGLKLVNTLIGWTQAFAQAYKAGTGIPGIFTKLADGFKYARFQGDGFFKSITEGFRNILGPIGKFVAGVGLVATSGISAFNIFKDWNMSLEDFGDKLLKTTVVVGGLTAAAFLLVSPFAAGATAIAGVGGAILGVIKARQEYEEELEKEAAYDKLFDGVGISAQVVSDNFKAMATDIGSFYTELDAVGDNLDKTNTNLSNSATSFWELHGAIMAGMTDDSTIEKLKLATDGFKDSVIQARDAKIQYNDTVLNKLREEGRITEEEYNNMQKSITDYYNTVALYQSEYADELTKLDIQLKNGAISQDEYNQKVGEIENKYAGVVSAIDATNSAYGNLYGVINRKINFKNEEEVKRLVEELTKTYDTEAEKMKEQHQRSQDYYNEEIRQISNTIYNLERRKEAHGSLTAEEQALYDKSKAALADMNTARKEEAAQYKADMEGLSAQYGNYLATINAQLVESGAYMTKEMEPIYDDIKDRLTSITRDTDITKAQYDLFGRWIADTESQGKVLSGITTLIFKDVGISASGSLFYELTYGTEKGKVKYLDAVSKYGQEFADTASTLGEDTASAYTNEMIDTLKKNEPDIKLEWRKTIDASSEGALEGVMYGGMQLDGAVQDRIGFVLKNTKSLLGIHSPSTVFKEIGMNIMFGLRDGIVENGEVVQGKLNELLYNMINKTRETKIDFNFNTNIESSFNTILGKLQIFANKWRTGINNVLSNTSKSFGSIVLDAMNKLRYTAMNYISIPTFAEGGYPTSGDLFLANENGRAEYITSLGNKTAVANQDQMVAALTNAITEGFNSTGGQRPGLTQIYIGNEKIYEGYGTYQNRQADRYGTTTIKV